MSFISFRSVRTGVWHLGCVLACLLPSLALASGPWGEVAQILPEATDPTYPDESLFFGYSVDVDGDWLIAGIPTHMSSGDMSSGGAFIYQRGADQQWRLHQRILFSTGDGWCGDSVAMLGRFIAVGCPDHSLPDVGDVGRVIIYQRTSHGVYEQPRIIQGTRSYENVGWKVAMTGTGEAGETYLAISNLGRFRDEEGRVTNGGVDVYRLTEETMDAEHVWTLDASLESPFFNDTGATWRFGGTIAIHRDAANTVEVAVGMCGWNDGTGRVFIFRRSGAGVWSHQATFAPPAGHANGSFGCAIALHGAHLVVGEPDARLDAPSYLDRLHAFVRRGMTWSTSPMTFDVPVSSPNYANNHRLSMTLHMRGADLWVAAPFWRLGDNQSGYAWRFRRTGSGQVVGDPLAYEAEQQLPATSGRSKFGTALVVDADGSVFFGAPSVGNGDDLPEGRIVVHHRDAVFRDGLEPR